MLNLFDITIDKKEYLESFLKRRCSINSEFSFTNLFMWRKGYDMKYTVIDDMLCILPKHGSGPRSATFPIGFMGSDGSQKDIKNLINTLLAYFEENKERPLIWLYNEKAVEALNKAFPDKFHITEDRNSFDYVYKTENLINLSGKKYHSKRNHVNRFMAKYDGFKYRTLTPDDKNQVLALFDKWSDNKDFDKASIMEEREAILELLDNWEKLNIVGGGLFIDDEMIAFSFGEVLCGDTIVIHLEHADTDYDGAFAAMNNLFLKNEWTDYTYVNREEDMGIPGMRKAKESYRPEFMVKKYVATLK